MNNTSEAKTEQREATSIKIKPKIWKEAKKQAKEVEIAKTAEAKKLSEEAAAKKLEAETARIISEEAITLLETAESELRELQETIDSDGGDSRLEEIRELAGEKSVELDQAKKLMAEEEAEGKSAGWGGWAASYVGFGETTSQKVARLNSEHQALVTEYNDLDSGVKKLKELKTKIPGLESNTKSLAGKAESIEKEAQQLNEQAEAATIEASELQKKNAAAAGGYLWWATTAVAGAAVYVAGFTPETSLAVLDRLKPHLASIKKAADAIILVNEQSQSLLNEAMTRTTEKLKNTELALTEIIKTLKEQKQKMIKEHLGKMVEKHLLSFYTKEYDSAKTKLTELKTTIEELKTKLDKYENSRIKFIYMFLDKIGFKTEASKILKSKDEIKSSVNIINKYLKSAEQQKTPDKQAVDEIKKDAGDLQEKIQDMKEKGLDVYDASGNEAPKL